MAGVLFAGGWNRRESQLSKLLVVSKSVKLDQDPMWSNREATKINLVLGKIGYSDAAITRWWNHDAYDELGGRTPTQVWNCGEYDRVKALVENLVSSQFASQLANNPTILKRLEESKNL